MKSFTFFLLVVLYFSGSFFLPWGEWSGNSTISFSYLFDSLFILGGIYFFKLGFSFKIFKINKLISKLIGIFIVGFFCLLFINLFKIKTPFPFIEHSVIQLLILAPIIEELLFRYVFFGIEYKIGHSLKKTAFINAALFSLSHALAFFILPSEFFSFLAFQVTYTFIISLLFTKAMLETKSILAPIILHFFFNLLFYLALIKGII